MSNEQADELDDMSQNFLWPPKMRVTARRKHEYGTYGYVRKVWHGVPVAVFGCLAQHKRHRRQHQHTQAPGAFQIMLRK